MSSVESGSAFFLESSVNASRRPRLNMLSEIAPLKAEGDVTCETYYHFTFR